MSWVFTVGFGLVAVGLLISLTYKFEGGPTAGVAACLFAIALNRRIMNARIILGASSMLVINPLVTFTVPYGAVAGVRGGGGETLNITTRAGEEIFCTAFGGSLIDNFVGSAGRASDRIEQQVRRRRKGTEQACVTKKLTVSWIADACSVGALACVLAAAITGV